MFGRIQQADRQAEDTLGPDPHSAISLAALSRVLRVFCRNVFYPERGTILGRFGHSRRVSVTEELAVVSVTEL